MKSDPEFNERWLHQQIAKDPSLLKLGDVVVRDIERRQPRAGRLDLLLQDVEADRRYVVEIQLGDTDESHLVRTLEYWDIERKRYPQYDHCAVIVAENITSRFLNVIGLFNGSIPLIAIQVAAMRVAGNVTLMFTKVLDELVRGPEDDGPVDSVQKDRAYWVGRSSEQIMGVADEVLELIRTFSPGTALRYRKEHIGLTEDGAANNFAWFEANKSRLNLSLRLDQSPEITHELEDAGLDLLTYNPHFKAYRIRLAPGDVVKHRVVLMRMLSAARQRSL